MLLDRVITALSTVYGLRPASMREEEFCVNEVIERMFTVLFDTGALHRSFIKKRHCGQASEGMGVKDQTFLHGVDIAFGLVSLLVSTALVFIL